MIPLPQKKTGFLTMTCILLVIVLAFIQFFLLRNNYELEKKVFFSEASKKILRFNMKCGLDSLQIKVLNNLSYLTDQYLAGKVSKREIFIRLTEANKQTRKVVNDRLTVLMNKDSLLRGTRSTFTLESVVLSIAERSDTLLASDNKPFVIIGDELEKKGSFIIKIKSDSVLIAPTIPNSLGEPQYVYKLNCRICQYMNAGTWKKDVLLRMTKVFILSFSTMVTIIFIVFYLLWVVLKQRELSQIQADFTNNINHELNTPLASLALIIKKLRRPDIRHDELDFKKQVDRLERQHNKIKDIVDQVLESSAHDTFIVEFKNHDVNDFLQRYVGHVDLPDRKFNYCLPQQKIVLMTDVTMLEKILDQLIQNAVKYSEADTSIRLTAILSKKDFEIRVRDQGLGISEKYREAVFDKFFRVPERVPRTVKGLGLGLYYCRQAALALGGSICVTSLPGSGSTFIVKLPLLNSVNLRLPAFNTNYYHRASR